MKRRIVAVGPMKLAITFAIIQGGMALVMMIPMSLIYFLSPVPPGHDSGPGAFFDVMSFIMPVIMCVMSFVFGLLIGYVYNFIAKFTGGIEVSVEDIV